MGFLAIAAACFLFLHCGLGSMSESRDDGDLRKLFSGYEPTKRTKGRGTIGARTAFPVQVTIEQGKEVFEYAKMHFSPAELEAAVEKAKYVCQRGSGLVFSEIVSRGLRPELCLIRTERLSICTLAR